MNSKFELRAALVAYEVSEYEAMLNDLKLNSGNDSKKVHLFNKWLTILLPSLKYNSEFAENISTATCARKATAYKISGWEFLH